MERVPEAELQLVCTGNDYDFDTGECKFFKDENGELGQCSKSPNCTFKVGEPVRRLKTKTRSDE